MNKYKEYKEANFFTDIFNDNDDFIEVHYDDAHKPVAVYIIRNRHFIYCSVDDNKRRTRKIRR